MGEWLFEHWFQVTIIALLAVVILTLQAIGSAVVRLLDRADDKLMDIANHLESEARIRRLEEDDRVAHYRASGRR